MYDMCSAECRSNACEIPAWSPTAAACSASHEWNTGLPTQATSHAVHTFSMASSLAGVCWGDPAS